MTEKPSIGRPDEVEQAALREPPQTIACRAYCEALLRTQDGYRDTLECEEIALKEALMALQRHYLLQADPWLKRLVKLKSLKPPKPIIITRLRLPECADGK